MSPTAVVVVLAAALVAQGLVLARDRSRPVPSWGARCSRVARALSGRSGVLVATGVGLVLRLGWVVWATRAPKALQDPSEYLRLAADFADGRLPVFLSGEPSAYWAPGYPLVLAPFVGLAEATGWMSPAFTASLVNTVAGSLAIPLTGILAAKWIGGRAAAPAAFLVALTPALVFWTSTAHTESVFLAVMLGALVLMTVAAEAGGSARTWAVAGLLVGLAVLIRGPGAVLLVVPTLLLWGRWRPILRATALIGAGAAVLLVPWTLRNGIQVGVWVPTSTANATGPCLGNHDDAGTTFDDPTLDLLIDCYRYSPFDDDRLEPVYAETGGLPPEWEFAGPDEPRWYRRSLNRAVAWAAGHPLDEVRLTAARTWEAWDDEDGALAGARNYSEGEDWAGRWSAPLALAADLWLWLLIALAVAGLVSVEACRRARVAWGLTAAFTLTVAVTLAYPQYRYPALPLLACLGAGFLVGPRSLPGRASVAEDGPAPESVR